MISYFLFKASIWGSFEIFLLNVPLVLFIQENALESCFWSQSKELSSYWCNAHKILIKYFLKFLETCEYKKIWKIYDKFDSFLYMSCKRKENTFNIHCIVSAVRLQIFFMACVCKKYINFTAKFLKGAFSGDFPKF